MQEQKRPEDRVDRAEQEEASLQAVAQLTKKCPRETYASRIEKNGGCNQMTCKFSDCILQLRSADGLQAHSVNISSAGSVSKAGRLEVMAIIVVGRRRLDDLVPVSGDIKREVIRL